MVKKVERIVEMQLCLRLRTLLSLTECYSVIHVEGLAVACGFLFAYLKGSKSISFTKCYIFLIFNVNVLKVLSSQRDKSKLKHKT